MRDYGDATRDKANQLAALLTAWLEDLERVDGTSELHAALLDALSSSLGTLERVETLARSPRPDLVP